MKGKWQEVGEGLLGLVMKTRDKENGSTESTESCLDPQIPFPVIRVPVTCTACK